MGRTWQRKSDVVVDIVVVIVVAAVAAVVAAAAVEVLVGAAVDVVDEHALVSMDIILFGIDFVGEHAIGDLGKLLDGVGKVLGLLELLVRLRVPRIVRLELLLIRACACASVHAHVATCSLTLRSS